MVATSRPKSASAGLAVPIIFLSAYFSLPPSALELANAFITKGDPPDVLIAKNRTADVAL